MKYLFIVGFLLLVSCSTPDVPSIQEEQNVSESVLNNTERLDVTPLDIPSVPDVVLAEGSASEPSKPVAVTNTSAANVTSNVTESGFMAQYRALVDQKVKYYAFDYEYEREDDVPGVFLVFKMDDWRVIEGGAWEVNQSNKLVKEVTTERWSEIDAEVEEEEEDEDKKINYTHHLVNYFWTNLTTGQTNACWIDVSTNSWNSEDCTSFSDDNLRVIYEDVNFDFTLRLPEYWLWEFEGQTPIRPPQSMTYTDSRLYVSQVDRIEYSTGVNTDIVLFVHKGYGLPLEVQKRADKKITERIRYDYMTVNYPVTQRWYPDFLRP